MYVILVNDDDTLLITNRERIMQRSKLFNDLWFLVNPVYNGYSMADCTVLLEYTLPVSRKYRSEILTLSEDAHNGYLKYLLPIDTNLTAEAGAIELQLTFIYSGLDVYANSVQRVRKTMPVKIDVTPISAWSDIIPDSALTALDQRIIKMDAQICALNELGEALITTKADDLRYNEESNELQLVADGREIGTKVTLNTNCVSDKDGVPVVDINVTENNPGDSNPEVGEEDDVIEF